MSGVFKLVLCSTWGKTEQRHRDHSWVLQEMETSAKHKQTSSIVFHLHSAKVECKLNIKLSKPMHQPWEDLYVSWHNFEQVIYIPSPLEEKCSQDQRLKQPAEQTHCLHLVWQCPDIKNICYCSLLFSSRVWCSGMVSFVPHMGSWCLLSMYSHATPHLCRKDGNAMFLEKTYVTKDLSTTSHPGMEGWVVRREYD